MKASTQQWLEFAKADLVNCERILDDEFLSTIVAFHSQQAVEKCFKALIEENNLIVPRIHNLIRLYEIIEVFLEKPVESKHLFALDSVYTSSRYPSDIGIISTGKPTLKDARELYEIAKSIFESVQKILQ
jgi:HEPN domain-containing protein